ncbi:MAG: polyphosphate kinase 2 (PPK2 family) [Saprospiraceae bacterium]|jgi:polyphosphate kinase 2 (PPK2 family)
MVILEIPMIYPRSARVVALGKSIDVEKGQWYFRRYVKELSNLGEIVFFDRSWYNRALVEPANDFCTEEEYARFMGKVLHFKLKLRFILKNISLF